MGLSNLFSKRLIVAALVLWAGMACAQTDVTRIPKKLRIGQVPSAPANGDMMLTLDTFGNVKKDTIPTGGGGTHATGSNGLFGTDVIGLGVNPLNQNTTINSTGFSLFIKNNSTDILDFQNTGGTVAKITNDGLYRSPGISDFASSNNSFISTNVNGARVSRSIADSRAALTVVNNNFAANGLTLNIQNYYRSLLSVDYKGTVQQATIATAASGSAKGYWMLGGLKPIANNDKLVGLQIEPIYGTSTTSTWGTLVGGSGYPSSTSLQFALLDGGTGFNLIAQVMVTGGVIVSYTIVDTGINYNVGDVVSFRMFDASGTVTGSGGHITVTGVTSFTGIVPVSAWFKVAPIQLDAISTPAILQDGMIWHDGTHLNARLNGVSYQLDQQVISNSFSATGSATTTFTVTIGTTQASNTYRVSVTPTSVVAAASFYVTNKTTTTFQVVYPSGLTGLVKFDYSVMK